MFSRNKDIECPADQWTKLAETSSSGMPRTYQYQFEGEEVDGEFRVSTSMLPFCMGLNVVKSGELKRMMSFDQGWLDVSFRIEVKPSADVKAVKK